MRSPVLVGAVGGSGTRVVARILAHAGFFIGGERNEAEDSEPVMRFYNAWMRPWLENGGAFPPASAATAAEDFRRALAGHRRGIAGPDAPWVVKVPRSLLMLPFWRQAFPDAPFIHMVRNGLDMAFSSDGNQVRMFADLVLPPDERTLEGPLRAMAYWRTANLRAAPSGPARRDDTYALLRFEDLCARPGETIAALAHFLGVTIDSGAAAREIAPPASIGRWRRHGEADLRRLLQLGRPALAHFGYWDAELAALTRSPWRFQPLETVRRLVSNRWKK